MYHFLYLITLEIFNIFQNMTVSSAGYLIQFYSWPILSGPGSPWKTLLNITRGRFPMNDPNSIMLCQKLVSNASVESLKHFSSLTYKVLLWQNVHSQRSIWHFRCFQLPPNTECIARCHPRFHSDHRTNKKTDNSNQFIIHRSQMGKRQKQRRN